MKFLNGWKTMLGATLAAAPLAYAAFEAQAWGELCVVVGGWLTAIGAAHKADKIAAAGKVEPVKAPAKPIPNVLTPLLIGALALGLSACTTTNYNIDFHEGAFRVADELKVSPGQGGDDGSSASGGENSGGEEGAPSGSNSLNGFAQQGNIFQIGTAAKSEGEARTNLQSNSQGDTDQGGTGSTRTGGDTGGDTGSESGTGSEAE
jgi:hypothetical protein